MSTKAQHAVYYSIAMVTAFALLFMIFHYGPTGNVPLETIHNLSWFEAIRQELMKNISGPITGLILQILTILIFSRVCGCLLQKIGQPQVIGEMLAGIFLGKSVFAVLWPEGFHFLFSEASMPRLYLLSQLGLIFFMFVVGLHLKTAELKNRAGAAVLISHVSIVFPFILGSFLAIALYKDYGPAHFDFISFALFMGIAMSITAFPVLARILQEKKLTNTPLGTMALTCAAVDDVTAWCVLAAVIGIVKAGSIAVAVASLIAAIVFVVFMFKIVKPFIEKKLQPALSDGEFKRTQLAFLFLVLFVSCVLAELIGIHALFGAFIAGTIMPQSEAFRVRLIDKIEDLTAVVLVPIFFAYTGIRTEIGLLNSADAWFMCIAIIVVAVIGKMAGSAFAARVSGMSWPDSWAIGSLMNTRGLMELVVLNIGYDLGLLSPTLFAMLVMMALVTTAMTSPLLSIFVTNQKKAQL